MKMSDMFDLPLDCSLVDNANIGYAVELECDKSVTEDQACAVDYAINNHDRMAEEIAELKGVLREARGALSACSIQESRNDGSENRMKINALDKQVYEIDSLLAKLNQEGEE